jgi:hypothetical protein
MLIGTASFTLLVHNSVLRGWGDLWRFLRPRPPMRYYRACKDSAPYRDVEKIISAAGKDGNPSYFATMLTTG